MPTLTKGDTARLLALAASYDRRTVGEADIAAWQAALDGLDPQRCAQAIIRHYGHSTDWIMPAHIRALAKTDTQPQTPTDDGETWCHGCKAVHHPRTSCEQASAQLQGPPANFRAQIEAIAQAKRLPPAPAHQPTAPTVPQLEAKTLEREKARQMAELEKTIDTTTENAVEEAA